METRLASSSVLRSINAASLYCSGFGRSVARCCYVAEGHTVRGTALAGLDIDRGPIESHSRGHTHVQISVRAETDREMSYASMHSHLSCHCSGLKWDTVGGWPHTPSEHCRSGIPAWKYHTDTRMKTSRMASPAVFSLGSHGHEAHHGQKQLFWWLAAVMTPSSVVCSHRRLILAHGSSSINVARSGG
jgi:hypothetical protein